jgi:hypothetical protein
MKTRLMEPNTVGELHGHVHYERESCRSEPPCKPLQEDSGKQYQKQAFPNAMPIASSGVDSSWVLLYRYPKKASLIVLVCFETETDAKAYAENVLGLGPVGYATRELQKVNGNGETTA